MTTALPNFYFWLLNDFIVSREAGQPFPFLCFVSISVYGSCLFVFCLDVLLYSLRKSWREKIDFLTLAAVPADFL